MVKKQLLNDRQRDGIEDYLQDRPWVMPPYIRGLRMNAKNLDYEQMREDLNLLEQLATLDIRIGRKSNEFKELHAQMKIRQRGIIDKKARFEIKS